MDDREIKIVQEWLQNATERELRDYIETEEYSLSTNVFLLWLIAQYELIEKYEFCQIIKDEIDFRVKLFDDINEYKTIRED